MFTVFVSYLYYNNNFTLNKLSTKYKSNWIKVQYDSMNSHDNFMPWNVKFN